MTYSLHVHVHVPSWPFYFHLPSFHFLYLSSFRLLINIEIPLFTFLYLTIILCSCPTPPLSLFLSFNNIHDYPCYGIFASNIFHVIKLHWVYVSPVGNRTLFQFVNSCMGVASFPTGRWEISNILWEINWYLSLSFSPSVRSLKMFPPCVTTRGHFRRWPCRQQLQSL